MTGFEVAGADGKFVAATAKIEGNHRDRYKRFSCLKPLFVRYGWANSPDCDLFNGEGIACLAIYPRCSSSQCKAGAPVSTLSPVAPAFTKRKVSTLTDDFEFFPGTIADRAALGFGLFRRVAAGWTHVEIAGCGDP